MHGERALRRALIVALSMLTAGCAVSLPETLLVVRIRHPSPSANSKHRFEVNLARTDAAATSIGAASFSPTAETTEMCIAVRFQNAPSTPTSLRVRVRGGVESNAQLRYSVVQTRDVTVARGEHKQVVFATQGQCSPDLERFRVDEVNAASAADRPATIRSVVESLRATTCFDVTAARCRAASPSCECRLDGYSVCLRDEQSCELAPSTAAGFRCVAPEQVDSAAFVSNVDLPVIDATQCLTMTM